MDTERRLPVDYRIFDIPENAKVSLIGELNEAKVIDPWLRITRSSISEGILESNLAQRAGSLMHNGNTYAITVNNGMYCNTMYIQMEGEYALIGPTVVINQKDPE